MDRNVPLPSQWLLGRRSFVGSLIAGALASRSLPGAEGRRDVEWLNEVQMAPAKIPANDSPLPPLLLRADGTKITSVQDWLPQRDSVHNWWLKFLGSLEVVRPERYSVRVLDEEVVGTVIRRRIQYDVEPGVGVEAYWLQPAEPVGKLRGAAVFHSTVDHSIGEPAGLGRGLDKAFGLKLAQRGFAAICPRNYLWTENNRMALDSQVQAFFERHPRVKGMARMLHDARVAVDILTQSPLVDAQRICAVGHSLGGKEVLYLSALDERIQATVSSEGGIGIRFSNWDAPWYLSGEVKDPRFAHDHHELLALVAPRPFLLVGGDSADGDRSWPFIESAMSVYQLYEGKLRLGLYNHREGHTVPRAAEEKIYDWLDAYT